MSKEQRYPYCEAMEVASELVRRLQGCCERIKVAGSLRRGHPTVGDAELLFVPRRAVRPTPGDFFGSTEVDLAAEVLGEMLADGTLEKRLSEGGTEAWGPQNKLAVHAASGLHVDLFSTCEANWWTALVVRTGGQESNIVLAVGAQRLGRKLNAYGCGVTMPDGAAVRAESEEHLFELCGIPYLKPEERP
jgi:DNA polymerase/3'-5' exonuclease PolX